MKQFVLGVGLALSLAGAAAAADFVVVSSTDPSLPRGREVTSGESLTIAPGKSIVLVDTAGQVVRLTGSAVAPRRQYASLNEERVAVLKMLVAPARVKRSGPSAGKVCPEADLAKFEGIVEVARVDGCLTIARSAFETYVVRAAGPNAP